MADRLGGGPGPEHATHDAELVAALLDDDLTAAERASGDALVASCPACARLHEDLRALAGATQRQPVPARTRDFRLTNADAARHGASAADTERSREPLATGTRLSGDMIDPRTASAHATHDTMLVASLADHSLAPADRAAAERLVAGCSLCAALHVDLVAIRAATIELPTPARPRDYRLTESDAARLHRSGWRRWVAAFGSRDAFSRPLAIGLTTLGIVGILVSGAPLLAQGSATSGGPVVEQAPGSAAAGAGGAGAQAPVVPPIAGDSTSVGDVAVPAASAAPVRAAAGSPAPQSAVPAPAGSSQFLADQGRSSDTTSGGAKASAGAGLTHPVDATAAQGSAPVEPAPTVPPLVLLSGLLLLAGAGLFLLRWMARRFGA